ncbi:MAG: hypothetical protein MZV70_66515 [Desulfobacterales bacterium]|nr:hypothetical protein [Desulfobacterales bacterium]
MEPDQGPGSDRAERADIASTVDGHERLRRCIFDLRHRTAHASSGASPS